MIYVIINQNDACDFINLVYKPQTNFSRGWFFMVKNEKESSLFRKSTLERVSSPEQLNEYIKVTNPNLVIILIGIFAILIAGVAWVFFGGIPNTEVLNGTVVVQSDNTPKLYCYVPISTSKVLKEGMDVQITPDYVNDTQYGYIKGKVLSVGKEIVTNSYLTKNFKNPQLVLPAVSFAAQSGNVVEIEISLDSWTNPKGYEIEITDGTTCVAKIIKDETKPYEIAFNK